MSADNCLHITGQFRTASCFLEEVTLYSVGQSLSLEWSGSLSAWVSTSSMHFDMDTVRTPTPELSPTFEEVFDDDESGTHQLSCGQAMWSVSRVSLSTSGELSCKLSSGMNGETKVIVLNNHSGTAFATVTFNLCDQATMTSDGDMLTLNFTSGSGWHIVRPMTCPDVIRQEHTSQETVPDFNDVTLDMDAEERAPKSIIVELAPSKDTLLPGHCPLVMLDSKRPVDGSEDYCTAILPEFFSRVVTIKLVRISDCTKQPIQILGDTRHLVELKSYGDSVTRAYNDPVRQKPYECLSVR